MCLRIVPKGSNHPLTTSLKGGFKNNINFLSRYWVEGISLSIVGCIGVLGNLLSLKILKKDSMRKTTFDEMLTHLLILDTMLVIFFLVDVMTTIVFQSSPVWYKILYPYLIHPGIKISLSATVLMVVAVSADRQRAICHPMLYRVGFFLKFFDRELQLKVLKVCFL